jgi:hypothetical protein
MKRIDVNKNFIILGSPRSGSTWFAGEFAKEEDILMSGTKEDNYEAFNSANAIPNSNILKTHAFDNQNIVDFYLKYQQKLGKKYLGFKSFPTWHWDLRKLIDDNNMNIILLLRKSFFKTVGSLAIAYREGNFLTSSLEFKKLDFENDPIFHRHFYLLVNSVSYSIYISEDWLSNNSNLITKIYFEDILENKNYTNEKINNFLEREKHFSTDHVDKPWEDYFVEPEKVKKFIKNLFETNPYHYKALPDYVHDEVFS